MATAAFVQRATPGVGRIREAARVSLGEHPPEEPAAAAAAVLDADPTTGPPWHVGRVYQVPVSLVRENPVNARAIYSATGLSSLAASIKVGGQECAALGYVQGDTIVLIDGLRRLKAVQSLGLPTLRIEINEKPDSEIALYLRSWNLNRERNEQTPLDDAIVWNKLLDQKFFKNQAELAAAVGSTTTEVSRTLALGQLPPAVIQVLSEKPELLKYKMLNAIREYAKACDSTEKTLALVVEVATEEYGYREVEARRKALEAGPRKRATPVSKSVRFNGGAGTIKEFESAGRIELTLAGLAPEDLQALKAKLEAIFT